MATNEYKLLSKILEQCLSLDKMAHDAYTRFASECTIPGLAKEWELRAEEEKGHMIFWKKALRLSEKKLLPLIFEDSEEINNKLKKIHKTFTKIFSTFNDYGSPSEELTLGFLIESHMLHPSFLAMFNAYEFINKNIARDYEAHIITFTKMLKRYQRNLNSLRIELFNDNLYDLYLANKKLSITSIHDSLTDLYNRRGFFSNIKPFLSLAARGKLNVGIIMIDFDNFKSINDTLGHQAGDMGLKAAAAIVKSSLRESCIVARYGGDEFIAFCDTENKESLAEICERIRQNIDKNSKKEAGIHFTVSIGGVTSSIKACQETSIATIIREADKNLLAAKEKGKNCWVL